MNKLLPEGRQPTVGITLVPGIGHDSSKLTVTCQKAISWLKWVQPSALQTFRKWKTGRKTVMAIYIDHNEEEVTLAKTNGKEVTVSISDLSKDDQALLAKTKNTTAEASEAKTAVDE